MLKSKNILSSAIAVALCLSLNTTAFAAKNNSQLTEKQLNSISLTNSTSNELLENTDSTRIENLKADSMTDKIEALTSNKSLTTTPKYRSAIPQYTLDSADTTTAPQVYAKEISTNVTYTDTINKTGDIYYYLFDTTNLQKITAIILFKDEATFSTNLYKYTDEGLELAAQSPMNFPYSDSQTISAIPEDGVYVLEVISSKGTGDFNFRVQTSSSYSSNEANDSIFQANEYTNSISTTDTFDNPYDFDWSKLVVSKDCEYKISTSTNNCSISSFQIFNLDTGNVMSVTNSQNTVTLEKGTYYILINGTTTAVDNSYTLKILPRSSIAASVKAKAGNDYMDYRDGYGPTWRFSGTSFTVTGTAYNEDGQIAANAEITVATKTPLNNKLFVGTGTADENGNFSIVVNVDNAVGQYIFDNTISMHKYDVIPIVFFNSNMDNISSNMKYLYHYATSY